MRKKFKIEAWQRWLAFFLAGASALTICFRVAASIDNRYAKAQNVAKTQEMIQKVSERLDRKILNDQYQSLQERLWLLTDRYEGKKIPQETKEEIRKLETDLEKLNEELKKLDKEGN